MSRLFNYAVVQLAPIMINMISWKTYFVFFCFNAAHIPIFFLFFPETNGYKLERLDAIFADAHDRGENPVWTERTVRKGGVLDIEQSGAESGEMREKESEEGVGREEEKRE